MSELFDVPVNKSPRLKWKERHRIVTQEFPDRQPGDEDEFGNELFKWEAWQRGVGHCGGETEDEAMVNLAKARGFKSWTEENA